MTPHFGAIFFSAVACNVLISWGQLKSSGLGMTKGLQLCLLSHQEFHDSGHEEQELLASSFSLKAAHYVPVSQRLCVYVTSCMALDELGCAACTRCSSADALK